MSLEVRTTAWQVRPTADSGRFPRSHSVFVVERAGHPGCVFIGWNWRMGFARTGTLTSTRTGAYCWSPMHAIFVERFCEGLQAE